MGHITHVNLLGDNIETIQKNTGTLIDASKEVGLEINLEKTKYTLLSRHQNVGQNRDIKIANRSFENASQFKYFGMTVTNQDLIQILVMLAVCCCCCLQQLPSNGRCIVSNFVDVANQGSTCHNSIHIVHSLHKKQAETTIS
jgi:hypothetical protein